MELKVWVEGIQRIVCGITEQTTVQEVVIALAQATGRTGRYTLVEKWRDTEKLLPPSEYPIKILEKWAEYSGEVHFLLKRTGASSTNSDNENVRGPERNMYRQSLPPLAKNRDKSELLQALKRKEPKRKSLTITGGTPSYYEDVGNEMKTQNSNGNNNVSIASAQLTTSVEKKPSSRDRTFSGSSSAKVKTATEKFSKKSMNNEMNKSKDKSKSKHKTEKKEKEESKTKKALMPLHMQKYDLPGNTNSATKALFPSDSKSDVEAKSPVRKNADNSMIKNLNTPKKVPLMPPTNKVLRNRNYSNFDKAQQSSSQDSPNHARNLSSGSLTPTPFSLPNENKLNNYAYRYGNSLPRSKKKSWSESPNTSVVEKQINVKDNKKTPLMPPVRKRAMTPNPTSARESFHPALRDSYRPTSPIAMSPHKNSEQAKARKDFTRLVSEQQKHIDEQLETMSALDEEVKILLEKMQQKEKAVKDEITKLEGKNTELKIQMKNEEPVSQELLKEDNIGLDTQNEMDKLQGQIDNISENVASYKRKIEDLSQMVADETYLKKMKQRRLEEENRNSTIKSRKDIERINWEVSSAEKEIRKIEKMSVGIEEGIGDKYSELEALNRELRQVNLQQFIRQTGSKVTVLPPSTEDQQGENSQHKMFESNSSLGMVGSRSPLPPQGSSEGVWV